MYTQSPRFGIPHAAPSRRAREATVQGRAAQSARPLTLSDLHTLVVNLEARMVVQEEKIAELQQDNSNLWQEIHRLKGPRFPLEIFFSIVNSARDDKKALKTFSLVCRSWLPITRKILFARISLTRYPTLILDNPHCTVFPHVRAITIDGSTDWGDDLPSGLMGFKWLYNFLVHMPKFTALTSLTVHELAGSSNFDAIDRAIPPAMKRRILVLQISHPVLTISAIAAFISNFTELTTLECGEIYVHRDFEGDPLEYLLGTNETLDPPPSSI
ncbi:hypothetical protein B0H13DRAFT_2665688, partial [Mycena leptocephala]